MLHEVYLPLSADFESRDKIQIELWSLNVPEAVGDERSMDNLRVSKDTPTNYEAFTCALMTVGEGMQSKPFLNLTYQLVDKDLSKVEDRRDVFNIGDGCVLSVEEKVILPQSLKPEVVQVPDAEA